MAQETGAPRYPAFAIAVHWIVALCVLGLLPAGVVLARLDDGPTQARLFLLHTSVGLLVLGLTLLRIGMRIAGRMPQPSAILTPFERVASRTAHLSLYVLMLVTPVVGWLGASAYGADLSFFGLFSVPTILAKNEELSDEIFAVHMAAGILITLVIVAHIIGAVVHKMRHDGVNERMLPGR